jgi:hypothetical protein
VCERRMGATRASRSSSVVPNPHEHRNSRTSHGLNLIEYCTFQIPSLHQQGGYSSREVFPPPENHPGSALGC